MNLSFREGHGAFDRCSGALGMCIQRSLVVLFSSGLLNAISVLWHSRIRDYEAFGFCFQALLVVDETDDNSRLYPRMTGMRRYTPMQQHGQSDEWKASRSTLSLERPVLDPHQMSV